MLIDHAWDAIQGGEPSLGLLLAEDAVAQLRAHGGGGLPDAANAHLAVCAAALDVGDFRHAAEAAAQARDALADWTEVEDVPVRRLRFEAALAEVRCLRALGHYRLGLHALEALEQQLALPTGPLGEPAELLNERGILLRYLGDATAAVTCYESAWESVAGRQQGDDLAALHHNLAGALMARGQLAEARAHAEAGLALRLPGRHVLGWASDAVAYAAILLDTAEPAAAAEHLESAIISFEATTPPNVFEASYARALLARATLDLEDEHRAASLIDLAIEGLDATVGADHPDASYARATKALIVARRDTQAAMAIASDALAALVETLGNEHPRTRDVAALARRFASHVE